MMSDELVDLEGMSADREQSLRRYLLGQCGPGEADDVERSVLQDAAVLALMSVVEDELIEEYIDGELKGPDKVFFATKFLGNWERIVKIFLTARLLGRDDFLKSFALRLKSSADGFAAEPIDAHFEDGLTDPLRDFSSSDHEENLQRTGEVLLPLDQVTRARTYTYGSVGPPAARPVDPPPIMPPPVTRTRQFFKGAQPRPLLPWALVAAGGISVAIGGSWLGLQNHRLQSELNQALSEQARIQRRVEFLNQQLASLRPPDQTTPEKEETRVAQLELQHWPEVRKQLVPGVGISDPANILRLPATNSRIRLELQRTRVSYDYPAVEHEYASYEAVLQTVDGNKTKRLSAVKSDSIGLGDVIVNLPSTILRPGDYILLLSGRTPSGTLKGIEAYSLQVVK